MNKLVLLAVVATIFAVAVVADEPPKDAWWRKPLDTLDDLEPSKAIKSKFVAWVKKNGKKYHLSELETRYQLWKKAVKNVWEHNKLNKTWVAGINQFSASTKEELKNHLGAFKIPAPAPTPAPTNASSTAKRFFPSWIDWTQRGAVTGVKNQGGCGSCWAFAAAGALEGGKALAGKGLVDLSPQHIMDCGGLGGCQGGDPHGAIRWGGERIASWWDYPYLTREDGCRGANAQTQCRGFRESRSGNDNDAADLIAGGPASICFNVIDSFFSYRGGVFGEYCPHGCSHAVVAVGYAENCNNSGRNCYIVKNSWGPDWGTGGYFLIERGSNMCGIADYLGRPTNC